jgi:Flp pilus assembly protein TadG
MKTLVSKLIGRRRRSRGQSMVEFALVLPIFLLMLFGLIDMGRLVFASTTMSQAAREAARVASVQAYWVGSTDPSCNQPAGPVCAATEAAMRTNVVAAANNMMEPFGDIVTGDVHIACTLSTATPPSGEWTSPTNNCSSATTRKAAASKVSVRIAMDFQPITPLIGQFFNSIELSGSATMTIN